MVASVLKTQLFDAGETLVRIDYAFMVEVMRRHGGTADEASLAMGAVAARRAIDDAAGRAEAMLDERRLAEHLELVIDSSLESVEEPQTEIFRRTLARLCLEPGRAAYAGEFYSIDAVGERVPAASFRESATA